MRRARHFRVILLGGLLLVAILLSIRAPATEDSSDTARDDSPRWRPVCSGCLRWLALQSPREAAADEVFDWNITGFEATAAGGQNTIVISRTVTMMQLAVHDALNAIERRYEPYVYEGRAEPSAAPAAAIAAAARDVLVGVIPAWGKPEQRATALAIVDSAYGAALAKVPDGLPRNHGIASGRLQPQPS